MNTDANWVASMPEVYDRHLGPALFAPFGELLAARAAALTALSGSPAAPRVLELAAGTGIATAALIRTLPEARILATDLNQAMVSWAAERVPGAHWQQADAQQLDLGDHAFDLVVCQFGAMFFPDKHAAFTEAARVLAPSGSVLLSIWDTVETSDFPAALVAALAEVLPEDPPGFVVRTPHGYADPQRIRADLQAAGLTVDALDRVVLPGASPSATELARGFCLGTPLRFALAERGSLEDLTTAIGERMSERLGAGPVTGDLAAFVVEASGRR